MCQFDDILTPPLSNIGHDQQHEMMAFILIFALFASQFLILYWKKKHYRSYQSISLSGLYFFPVLFGIYAGWYRFIVFWTLFSAVNGFGKGNEMK
jgi:RING finger protein 121